MLQALSEMGKMALVRVTMTNGRVLLGGAVAKQMVRKT